MQDQLQFEDTKNFNEDTQTIKDLPNWLYKSKQKKKIQKTWHKVLDSPKNYPLPEDSDAEEDGGANFTSVTAKDLDIQTE